MTALPNRRFLAVAVGVSALLATLAAACGGGSSSAQPTPTSPTFPTPTQTPTSLTIYASHDLAVVWSSADPARANKVEEWFMMNHVGWGYTRGGDGTVSSIGWGLAFRFDVQSQIAGRDIAKATFRLDARWIRADVSVTPEIRVAAFQGDWNPATLNWNAWSGLACHSTGEARAPAPSAEGPLDFDVTTIVRNWASGAWGSYGLRASVDDVYPGRSSDAITSFQSLGSNQSDSQRPRLVIELK